MSRYARLVGRRHYPRSKARMTVAHRSAENIKDVISRSDSEKTLVAAGTKIDGVVKSAISPEILKKTEGLPWHARCARISALTGIPFIKVNEALHGSIN